jgi:hypothetical protein
LADVIPTEANGRVIRKPGEGNWEEWRGETFDGQVKIACATCNNGWMNGIETDARPLLSQMVHGRRTRLKPSKDQLYVARWAWLKALVVQFTNPSTKVIPDVAYATFRSDTRPSPTSHIWLGYLDAPILMPDGRGVFIAHSRSSSYVPKPISRSETEFRRRFLQEGNLFSATLVVGRLVMFVVGCDVTARLLPIAQANACFQRIWPLTGTANWPPPNPLGTISKTAEDLVQFFEAVEP